MNARASSRVAALATVVLSCSSTQEVCVTPPCAPPIAVIVTVTSSASTPLGGGAFVLAPGYVSPIACNGTPTATCYVPGFPGTYELDIGAPGFATVHRNVAVRGTDGGTCGCTQMATEHLEVALAPAK